MSRDDNGSVSLTIAVAMPALVALLGLVVDGGLSLAERQRIALAAEAAARAGANELDVDALHRNLIRLDPQAATAVAQQQLQQGGYAGTVSATPDAVTVTVMGRHSMTVLALVGVRHVDLTGTATARPISTLPGAGG